MNTTKVPCQNTPGQLNISPRKSHLYVHPDHGDTTWYHHNLDGHKNRIFTREIYGAVQVHLGPSL